MGVRSSGHVAGRGLVGIGWDLGTSWGWPDVLPPWHLPVWPLIWEMFLILAGIELSGTSPPSCNALTEAREFAMLWAFDLDIHNPKPRA